MVINIKIEYFLHAVIACHNYLEIFRTWKGIWISTLVVLSQKILVKHYICQIIIRDNRKKFNHFVERYVKLLNNRKIIKDYSKV